MAHLTEPCALCRGDGWLCERHPEQAWEHDSCRSAGVPCGCNPTADMPPGFNVEIALPTIQTIAVGLMADHRFEH